MILDEKVINYNVVVDIIEIYNFDIKFSFHPILFAEVMIFFIFYVAAWSSLPYMIQQAGGEK